MDIKLISGTLLRWVRVWQRGDGDDPVIPYVNTLGSLGVAKRVVASAPSLNTQIAATTRAVSVHARGGAIRYTVGVDDSIAADNATSHYLAQGERAEFMIATPCWIAAIRASDAGADGVLEITELL